MPTPALRTAWNRTRVCACSLLLGVGIWTFAISGPATGATSAVVVDMTVPSATNITTTGCDPDSPGSTALGTVLPGSIGLSSADCDIVFGSSNDTASLRVGQSDVRGVAMFQRSSGVADGTFDGDASMPGYPGNGSVTSDWGNGVAEWFGSVEQPDGKLVAAGSCEVGTNPYFCVARYLPNGTLDPTFDGDASMSNYPGNGIVAFSMTGASRGYGGVLLRPDGSILVGGKHYVSPAVGDEFALVQLRGSDGAFDTGFDGDPTMPGYPGNGKVSTPFGASNDVGRAMVLQPDGKVVLAGVVGSPEAIALVRYDTDGTLDTTFDGDPSMTGYPGNGKVTTPVSGGSYTRAMALYPDGRLVVAGARLTAPFDAVIARYGSTGMLDATFDGPLTMPGYPGNGIVTIDVPGASTVARAVAVQRDGSVLWAGGATVGSDEDFVVGRLAVDGSRDASYDGDASTVTFPANGTVRINRTLGDRALGVVIDADEYATVVGRTTTSGTTDTAVLRLDRSGALDTAFDGDPSAPGYPGNGVVVRDVAPGVSDHLNATRLASDGKTIHVGSAGPSLLTTASTGTAVADYALNTSDWDTPGTNAFGACLRGVNASATAMWSATGSCTSADTDPWQAVPALTSAPGALVARTSASTVANARVSLRFGLRTAANQPPGRYVSPVVFEVVAPMT